MGLKGNKTGRRKRETDVKNGTHGVVLFVGKVSCRMKKVRVEVC
jgi:hypothetical protein